MELSNEKASSIVEGSRSSRLRLGMVRRRNSHIVSRERVQWFPIKVLIAIYGHDILSRLKRLIYAFVFYLYHAADLICSHGRDSKLIFWHLDSERESRAGLILPVDHAKHVDESTVRKPPILHQMTVNTLNFCAFACCWNEADLTNNESVDPKVLTRGAKSLLLALPHTLSSEAVDIYDLLIPHSLFRASSAKRIMGSDPKTASPPSEITSTRVSTIPAPSLENPKTGLTMCLALPSPKVLIAGYEGGQAIVYGLRGPSSEHGRDLLAAQVASAGGSAEHAAAHASWVYSPIYLSRPHSQPILSLAVHPQGNFFVTTSADAVIARHHIPLPSHDRVKVSDRSNSRLTEEMPEQIVNTKHAGQQGASFRDDGMIFATAGWDCRGRVYKAGTVDDDAQSDQVQEVQEEVVSKFKDDLNNMKKGPSKSKGKNTKELAVLKWHKEGCYCVGFAHVTKSQYDSVLEADEDIPSRISTDPYLPTRKAEGVGLEYGQQHALTSKQSEGNELKGRGSRTIFATMAHRLKQATTTHWLAMGSKDGRVSLWDIY